MATYPTTGAKEWHRADGAANFGSGYWNSAQWITSNVNIPIRQGYTTDNGSNGSCVSFFYLDDVGNTLTGKVISNISLYVKYGSLGSSSTTKTLVLHKATKTTAPVTDDNIKGSALVSDELGSLAVPGRNQEITYTLNNSENSALFSALSSYLSGGGKVITIYNGETTANSTGVSTNFLDVTDITMVVTYTDPGYAYYKNNGTWVKCKVYYKNNGSWVQVKPYYKNNGTWTLV